MRAVRKRVGLRMRQWLFNSAPLLILLAFSVCVVLLFPYDETLRKIDRPKPGTVSKETVIAPFTFDVIRTHEELERERKRAMDQVLLVMDYDSAAVAESFRKTAELETAIRRIADSKTSDTLRETSWMQLSRELSGKAIETLHRRPALLDEAKRQIYEIMERGVSATLFYATNEELSERRMRFNTNFESAQQYSKRYVNLLRDGMESTVAVSDIPVKEAAMELAAAQLRREPRMDDAALNAVYELIHACVRPTVRVNNRVTSDRRRAAADQVHEVSGKVIKDTEIVRKHQEVTTEIAQRLQSLHVAMERLEGGAEKRQAFGAYAGRVILLLITLCFLAFYMRKYNEAIVASPKSLLALCIVVVLQILVVRLGTQYLPILLKSDGVSAVMPEYMIPVTMGALLSTILFGMRVSVIVSLFVGIYFAVAVGFNHYFFLYAFLNSVVAIFFNYKIRYRWHFFRAIPPMTLVSVVIITVWQMMSWRFGVTYLTNITCAFVGIVASVFMAMVLSPFFERVFDITTDMTLIELSDMNHPILKKLSIQAAGTYNHSVLVGNLAESAAQAIGANALLARVASYYHDIGKIDIPDYFVENCLGDKNRHNKLSPTMSALIICSHVKEGVELAKKYKLPKIIQDIIMQHHGDSSVSFFYEKALELDPHKQVQEKDFRYPGPIPQTREAAIIMLADSVEAASRSLATSSPKLLRELVKKIIRDKFLAAQFDGCSLTLRDLNDITEGFMPILQGIFHTRIEYPNK